MGGGGSERFARTRWRCCQHPESRSISLPCSKTASAEIETKFEQKAKKENALGHVFVTRWTRSDDVPYWPAYPAKSGKYEVEIQYAATRASAGTEFTISIGDAKVTGKVEDTGGNWVFKKFTLGKVALKAGEQIVKVSAKTQGTEAMNLEAVVLKPVR